MDFADELAAINGAEELRDWFGYWPNFHDAEIISLGLNRADASTLVVYTWEMTNEIDAKGYYVSAKHVVVEFVMNAVFDLSLSGFNHQNVVSSLSVARLENGYRLTLGDCFGIAGTIDAEEISIRSTPGKLAPTG
jgi:Immunity protein 50